MQRQTLVPLKEFMAERPASGRGTRVLEVAGGTGRFATFLKVLPAFLSRRHALFVPF